MNPVSLVIGAVVVVVISIIPKLNIVFNAFGIGIILAASTAVFHTFKYVGPITYTRSFFTGFVSTLMGELIVILIMIIRVNFADDANFTPVQYAIVFGKQAIYDIIICLFLGGTSGVIMANVQHRYLRKLRNQQEASK